MTIKSKQLWVLASSNTGKVTELNNFLALYTDNITLRPQSDFNIKDIDETGWTFIENALLKARNASEVTKLPALADDSGLVVPCLNGEPGLYSARYAATGNAADNIAQLIAKLNTRKEQSVYPAYFYCVLVLLRYPRDPAPIIAEGSWHGFIIPTPKGTNGFGYDPIFLDPDLKITAAEMSLEQKQMRSHRGKAFNHLITNLQFADILART